MHGPNRLPPNACADLDTMIVSGVAVRATCWGCGAWEPVDLRALRNKVGGTYSLIDRRTACRKPGCAGRVRFSFVTAQGFRPLETPRCAAARAAAEAEAETDLGQRWGGGNDGVPTPPAVNLWADPPGSPYRKSGEG